MGSYLTVLILMLSAAQAVLADSMFESQVLPVLRRRCYECHSHEKKIKGGLALDSRSGWAVGGDSGPAVVPGDVEKSLLLKAVRYLDTDLQMPPRAKLPMDEIRLLEQWVQQGADDPRGSSKAAPKKTVDIEAGRQHWAFQPVVAHRPPTVKDMSWPMTEVDAFLLAKLDEAGLSPSRDVDRHTWLRRVSLDLTGLPPSVEEIRAFATDQSPRAYDRVVDRLLAAPAFGERWARHWMDLTGYADQIGTSNSVFAEHAWRYRDYLIHSFNQDKPFGRFLREQIAGDLLPWKTAEERAENLTATGFLVLGDVEIVNPDKLRMEHDVVDQQLNKVGMTFMGMTLGCVRCHDHKFDPIGLDDYYGMAGMFRSTSSTVKIPNGIWSSIQTVELPETMAQHEARMELATTHQHRLAVLRRMIDAEPKDSAKRKPLAGELEHAEFFTPRPPLAFAVRDGSKLGDMQITIRGNPHALGAVVQRGVMRVASWAESPAIPASQSGRLQLADWLADSRHPLTARVTVNRIWQKLFGAGIVRSVDYFGTRGAKPSHPELLDALAAQFMREGWSQKRLIRSLVLSHAYRLSSESSGIASQVDAENRLLWRMNGQRLDAEALRDSLNAVAGVLVPSHGGPALPLEYPENSSSLRPQAVNPPAFALRRFRPEQEFQRTIYLPVIRSAQPGPARLRDVFDFTQPAQMAGQRPQTVVPTQALFLLNSQQVRQRADALATVLLSQGLRDGERLEQLWLRVLSRPITAEEYADAMAFLQRLHGMAIPTSDPALVAWVELCHSVLSSNEFLHRL